MQRLENLSSCRTKQFLRTQANFLMPNLELRISAQDAAGLGWRGRNNAAKALQPPVIDRRNIFSLYPNLDTLSDLQVDRSDCTLTQATLQQTHNAKVVDATI